jgi:hypothetical protein
MFLVLSWTLNDEEGAGKVTSPGEKCDSGKAGDGEFKDGHRSSV